MFELEEMSRMYEKIKDALLSICEGDEDDVNEIVEACNNMQARLLYCTPSLI